MASGNAYRALDAWPDIPATARLVLLVMALTARDNPTEEYDAAHYFGGAEFLQQKVWGRVDESTARQLKKAITTLTRKGAIRRRVHGAPGRRAEYDLVLNRPEQGTEMVPEQGTVSDRTGDRNGPDGGTETVPPIGTTQNREKREKEKPPQGTNLSAPVDNSAQDEIDAEMTTEEANRILIARYERNVHDVIAQHETRCGCADAARHLATTPALRVIPGGAA